MKQIIAFFSFIIISVFALNAQTEISGTSNNDFLKQLTSAQSGQGTIQITQDPRLPQSIAERQTYTEESQIPYILISGYRVQVYSSNVPKTARSEAFSMESAVKEKMPDVTSYVSFSSPFWKVRLGDCKTYQEAMVLLNEVKENFPEHKNNFYIVKEDNIRIPIK